MGLLWRGLAATGSGSPHHRGSDLDYTHWHSGEEGEAAPLPAQAAEEIWSLLEDPPDLLRWCGGEHPDRKHHCLVQQQLLSGQEDTAEGSAFHWTHSPPCRRCRTRSRPSGLWTLTSPGPPWRGTKGSGPAYMHGELIRELTTAEEMSG